MKKVSLWLCFCLTLATLAQENAYVIRLDREEREVHVAETGFFREVEVEEPEELVSGSLAALIAAPGKRFYWSPGDNPDSLSHAPWLIDNAVSSDGSVLAVLERMGERNQAQGSRVILFSTASGRIIGSFRFPGALKLARIIFIPESSMLLGVEERQREVESSANRLLLADLKEGKILGTRKLETVPASVVATDKRIFLKYPDDKLIFTFAVGASLEVEQQLETEISGGALILNRPDMRLLAAGMGGAEQYRIDRQGVTPEFKMKLPGDYLPQFGFPLPQETDGWLIGERGREPLVLLDREKVLTLEGDSSGLGIYDENNQQAILTLEKNLTLGFYTPVNDSKVRSILNPNKLRPATRGEIIGLYLVDNTLLLLNSQAELLRVQQQKRRWEKVVLFAPKQ